MKILFNRISIIAYLFTIPFTTMGQVAYQIVSDYNSKGELIQSEYSNGIVETWQYDETGNIISYEISSTMAPNLAAGGSLSSTNLELGSSISIDITSTNTNSVASAPAHCIEVWFSADNVWDDTPEDMLLGGDFVQTLQPGQSFSSTISVDLPVSFSANTAYLIIKTDCGGVIQEPDEADNYYVIPITLYDCAISVSDIITIDSCATGTMGSIELAVDSGGLAPFTFEWNDATTGATYPNPDNGQYAYTITDGNGCEVGGSVLVSGVPTDPLYVDYYLNPDHTIAYATVIGGTVPYQYQWDTGDTTSYTNVQIGEMYEVSVTDNYGCVVIFEVPEVKSVEDSIVNVIEVNNLYGIKVYPNPTRGIFYVESDKATIQYINIYNATGQLVRKEELSGVFGARHQLNLNQAAAGLYYLEIHSFGNPTLKIPITIQQ